MTVDQSPRKYGTGPGSNSLPLDLQLDSHLLPDTLPTELPIQLNDKYVDPEINLIKAG